jgi:hypothetical protein
MKYISSIPHFSLSIITVALSMRTYNYCLTLTIYALRINFSLQIPFIIYALPFILYIPLLGLKNSTSQSDVFLNLNCIIIF